jgi:hypothetical protein
VAGCGAAGAAAGSLVGRRCRVVAASVVVRAGTALASPKVGNLARDDEFEVLEVGQQGGGSSDVAPGAALQPSQQHQAIAAGNGSRRPTRIRFDIPGQASGWVSMVSKSGKTLVEAVPGPAAEIEPGSESDLEDPEPGLSDSSSLDDESAPADPSPRERAAASLAMGWAMLEVKELQVLPVHVCVGF